MRARWLFLVFVAVLIGCGDGSEPISPAEELSIATPPALLRRQLDEALPLAATWLNETAATMLLNARPLSPDEIVMAIDAGVTKPGEVRVALVDEMALPQDEPLHTLALQLGFANKALAGGAIGNLVWLNRKHSMNIALLAHELMHVAQQERVGQVHFLRRYFSELALVGYKRSAIEAEANRFMAKYK